MNGVITVPYFQECILASLEVLISHVFPFMCDLGCHARAVLKGIAK